MPTPSILLISKTDPPCRAAQRFLLAHAPDTLIVEGGRDEPLPDAVRRWSGEYLLSFLGPWIIPDSVLSRASIAAVNFHPGPPAYPGIGCYNFALYDEVEEYGVVCHQMAPRVDTGRIVRSVRFAVFPTDTVASLRERSLAYLLTLFYDVASELLRGQPLTWSGESWERPPYTRRELNALCVLTRDMNQREIARRVRATTYPGAPGAAFADERA
jgi:methionyl-tRNA formyltransferase